MAQPSALTTDAKSSGESWPPAYEGRLGVYAALGGYARSIPLPWLPKAALLRIHGALLDDVAARHGVSLTRQACAELGGLKRNGGAFLLASRVARLAGAGVIARTFRSAGGFALLFPVRGTLQTYVLGRLFDRYLRHRRKELGHVIDVAEAARVRRAIDGAVARAFRLIRENWGASGGVDEDPSPAGDWMQRALQQTARIPARLARLLDAGFDDLIEHDHR